MNNKIIGIVDGEDQRKEYDICFTFVCYQTNRGYIAYTDHTLDESGKEILNVSAYDPEKGWDKLFPCDSPEEIEMIKEVIEKIKSIS